MIEHGLLWGGKLTGAIKGRGRRAGWPDVFQPVWCGNDLTATDFQPTVRFVDAATLVKPVGLPSFC
jgi:hypothetical protein